MGMSLVERERERERERELDANLNRHALRPNKNIGILAQEAKIPIFDRTPTQRFTIEPQPNVYK